MTDQGDTQHSIRINRAPVLTLWAAVVAERLGFEWTEALTLGRAVAGLNAYAKGKTLGLFTPTPQEVKAKRQARCGGETLTVELLHRAVPAQQTDAGLRALSKGKPINPDSVQHYLQDKFGAALEDAYAAMQEHPPQGHRQRWRLRHTPSTNTSGPLSPAFPNQPSRGPRTGPRLRPQPHASCTPCPDRTTPRQSLRCAAAAGSRGVLGQRRGKMPFKLPIRQSLFRRQQAWVKAVDGIDFTILPGETLGLIGESGCGKTTTAKRILLQETPTAGSIRFDSQDISTLRGQALLDYRRTVQVVFQAPYSSLSPRMRVGDIIAEPLEIHTTLSRQAMQVRVDEVLELVGLQPEMAHLFPHEFSGGQHQRIAIARALVTNTRLIVLDEPVSALDVSIRAQIINQLEHLQRGLGVSYLFMGHDLATVAHISHRIAVMYLGRIVEIADSQTLCAQPLHPYTRALFAAALPAHPDDQRDNVVITGEVPSAFNPPSGCHFHPRCPYAEPRCAQEAPALRTVAPHHVVACHVV